MTINLGQVSLSQANGINALLKLATTPNGPNVIQPSGLTDDGTTLLYHGDPIGGGPGSPAGSLQFNDAGAFGGSAFSYDPAGVGGQPTVSAVHEGEGTLSLTPDQISIVNTADDQTSSVLNDGNLLLTNLANTADYAHYSLSQVKIHSHTGAQFQANLSSITLEDAGSNLATVSPAQVQVQSGSDASSAVIDHTGLTINGSTSGSASIGVNSDASQLNLTAPVVAVSGLLLPTTIYSVAGTPLPSAATAGVGARAFVSDSTTNTFNANYSGGGTDKVPVFSDGTNWKIG